MKTDACSIVVPTYNRLPCLKKCLACLLKMRSLDFEIIVVDDGSSDGTKEYLDELRSDKVTTIHHPRNLGVSRSRNDGIKKAKHKIVVFCDDDCLAGENWLPNLLKGFSDSKIGFVFGPTFYVKQGHGGRFPEKSVSIVNWPGGNNIAYRRAVFARAGHFDSFFDRYSNEDTEMAIRAAASGFAYAFIPDAVCYHQLASWTAGSLIDSANNASVWPVLKKRYPLYYQTFRPLIRRGLFVDGEDYLYLLALPVLLPALLIRYLLRGERDLRIFFAKWPVRLALKRYYIYKEAVQNRVWMF